MFSTLNGVSFRRLEDTRGSIDFLSRTNRLLFTIIRLLSLGSFILKVMECEGSRFFLKAKTAIWGDISRLV